MKLKDALKRIEELERKVKELEAHPKQTFKYHYFHQPAYMPPQPQPMYPQYPNIWMGGHSGNVMATDGLGGEHIYKVM